MSPASRPQQQRLEIAGRQARALVTRSVLTRLPRPDRQLTEAMLRTMHDRHVGITPELAADLVKLVRAAQRGQQSTGLWAPLLDRLGDTALAATGEPTRRLLARLPGAGISYLVTRVAEPLVARACAEIGTCYLFADRDTPLPQGFAGAYAAYRKRLHRRLHELLGDGRLPELLWTDQALTLAAMAQPRATRPVTTSDLPATDVVGLASLHRLQPELPRRSDPRLRRRRSPVHCSPLRPLLHQNEGGVDGIHHTRRLADLPSRLLSELLHPPALQTDRLLSSGFLALRRPPRQVHRRDLLVTGILPWADELAAAAPWDLHRALARAAWLDCMLHLASLLQRIGLRHSELRWIEADRLGQIRTSCCLLEQQPVTESVQDGQPAALQRAAQLIGHGWLPGFLDEHQPVLPPPRTTTGKGLPAAPPGPGGGADGRQQRSRVQQLLGWSAAAWRSAREHPGWQHMPVDQERSSDRGGLQWREFGSVVVLLFLPQVEARVWRPELGALQHRFGLPLTRSCRLVLTSLPGAGPGRGSDQGWQVRARGIRRSVLAEPGAPPAQAIAAGLESAWLDVILEGLVGG